MIYMDVLDSFAALMYLMDIIANFFTGAGLDTRLCHPRTASEACMPETLNPKVLLSLTFEPSTLTTQATKSPTASSRPTSGL